MYINIVEINNIRSIRDFKMEFADPAGWHVLIGDNGAGKSSIIRSIALALVGSDEAHGLRPNWQDWLNKKADRGSIKLQLSRDTIDQDSDTSATTQNTSIPNEFYFNKEQSKILFLCNDTPSEKINPKLYNWGKNSGWFSAGYGPFRRFSGGSQEMEKIFENQSYERLASHLSLFGEDVALTEATKWLVNLNYQVLEKKISENLIDDLKRLVNSEDFLPHNTKLTNISSEGVVFTDGNGVEISVTQMSDGYRSILSLTFELIRQLVKVYGDELVFQSVRQGNMMIDLPGVVLVDEIDAHLHPTWQTRIGQWFIKYFPKLQFIVTTHSPLICRACEKGTIWRLAAPGSDIESGEITGLERDRLIFGNVLDAYGTEVFGKDVSISQDANEKRNKLAELNIKSIMGQISDQEDQELKELKSIFPTEKLT
jgi:predicted ATP-dependent endonuclease of OLD family